MVAYWPVSVGISWPASTDSLLACYSTFHGAVEKAGITEVEERDSMTEICRKHGFSHSMVHNQLGLSCNYMLRPDVLLGSSLWSQDPIQLL